MNKENSFKKRKVECLPSCYPPVRVEDNHTRYQGNDLVRTVLIVSQNSVTKTTSLHLHLSYLLIFDHHRLEIVQGRGSNGSYNLCKHPVGIAAFKKSPVHEHLCNDTS